MRCMVACTDHVQFHEIGNGFVRLEVYMLCRIGVLLENIQQPTSQQTRRTTESIYFVH